MSNEYKDWHRDTSAEAKEWVRKYPFLRFKDNSCCPWENTEEIESCWIFCLPDGWINRFGKQMCDELCNALGEYINDFVIGQMKEKFNELRLYWYWDDKDYTDIGQNDLHELTSVVEDIIHKYMEISYNTCTVCGAPATQWTRGYLVSFCNDCYDRVGYKLNQIGECICLMYIIR